MSIQPVSQQVITFLNESNRIEGINEIDYNKEEFQNLEKGHFGAYILSQNEAAQNQPLSVKKLRNWQALLGREQKEKSGSDISEGEIGHTRGPHLPKNVRIGNHIPPHYENVPLLIQNLVEDTNETLKANVEKFKEDDEAFTDFTGRTFLRFERIHPFGDGNGRMGRLVANYCATYCNRPILTFHSDMSSKNRYYEAHESEEKMVEFFKKRVTESQEVPLVQATKKSRKN